MNKLEEVKKVLEKNIKLHSLRHGQAVFTITSFEEMVEEICQRFEPKPDAEDEELLRRTIRQILAQPAYTTIDEQVSLVWNVLKEYGFVVHKVEMVKAEMPPDEETSWGISGPWDLL